MAPTQHPTAPVEVATPRRLRWAVTSITVLAAVIITAAVSTACGRAAPPAGPPLHPVGQIPLPGDSSRFDYASLDAGRGLLFIAHLGASQVIEVDLRAHRVVRTINNLSQVHGVLVVPERHRVYATATGTNQMVALDEDTATELGRAPTGNYPDGLAYDPQQATVWTTNESSGSETIIDSATYQVRGTVALGGEAGNVAYDLGSRMDNRNRQLMVVVREHVGDDAHVVAVDLTTGHSYYPLPTGPSGGPTLQKKVAP
jgi:hypothetical protein